MDASVRFERVPLGKSLAAVRTNEGALPRVETQVLAHVGFLVESLAALGALEGLLTVGACTDTSRGGEVTGDEP